MLEASGCQWAMTAPKIKRFRGLPPPKALGVPRLGCSGWFIIYLSEFFPYLTVTQFSGRLSSLVEHFAN